MSCTVLAVDDSASMRQLVSFTLKGAGYAVVEAVDGVDALEKLDTAGVHVKLIVADINMPNMDGLELVRRVRSNPAYRFVPVILLTTESSDARKQEGRTAGATGWIVKPFRPEQLVAVVKKVLG